MGMTNPPNPIQFWAHITAATTPEIPVPIPFPIQVPIPVGPLDPGWKTASATCSCLVLIYSGGWFIYRRLLWAPCCVIWGRRWVARDSQLTTLDLETTQKHPAAPQRKTFLEPPSLSLFNLANLYTPRGCRSWLLLLGNWFIVPRTVGKSYRKILIYFGTIEDIIVKEWYLKSDVFDQ